MRKTVSAVPPASDRSSADRTRREGQDVARAPHDPAGGADLTSCCSDRKELVNLGGYVRGTLEPTSSQTFPWIPAVPRAVRSERRQHTRLCVYGISSGGVSYSAALT